MSSIAVEYKEFQRLNNQDQKVKELEAEKKEMLVLINSLSQSRIARVDPDDEKKVEKLLEGLVIVGDTVMTTSAYSSARYPDDEEED